MSEDTKIEWCDYTFNPWIGCTKVSPGCANCYAESQDKFRSWTPDGWGKGKPRKRTSMANWKKPLKWNREAESFHECSLCGWRGNPYHENFGCCGNPDCSALPSELDRARPRVFCASLADVFDSEAPYDWRYDLFELIDETPELDWLILTKRPENIRKHIAEIALPICEMWDCEDIAPHNIWLGTSVEDQKRADERIPHLLSVPAVVRFLSVEPMLESIDLSSERLTTCGMKNNFVSPGAYVSGPIHWVIAGGESGGNSRICAPEWLWELGLQCERVSVPFFCKQLGGNVLSDNVNMLDWPDGATYLDAGGDSEGDAAARIKLASRKGGDMSEWPAELKVREFPPSNPVRPLP